MGNASSLSGKPESLTADELLVTKDSDLQGVKDKRLTLVIQSYTRQQIELLCLTAASGKVRDLAHRIVGRDLNMRAIKFVRENMQSFRNRYAARSAQEVGAEAKLLKGSPEGDVLHAIFREKSWVELKNLSTEQLRALQDEKNALWPDDILSVVLTSRVSPPGKKDESDWWREQA